MENFYTIQGEGYYQGSPAYFVRLAGCDVGCSWCDVKESWPAEKHPLRSIGEIERAVTASHAKICVITGGEPLMHDLTELTQSLKAANIRTHLETSGAYRLTGTWDWICLSPKRFKLPLPECLNAAHELKVIISHRNDFRFAEGFAKKVNRNCYLYLQPEWSKEAEILPMMIDYVKQNDNWRISLQIHKYMNIP